MNYFEKDTLGKKLVRSADFISANLAEGFGRYFYKENRQFCFYSKGSSLKTKNWLKKYQRSNIISSEKFEFLMKEIEELHIPLNAYIKTIGKTETERYRMSNDI